MTVQNANVEGNMAEMNDVAMGSEVNVETTIEETNDINTDPQPEIANNDNLLQMLQGDLSAEDEALINEFEEATEDEVSFDASDNNESLGHRLPPLKPTVKIVDGKKQVTLPIGYVSEILVRENQKEDSKGYFLGQKQSKLIIRINGFKHREADAQTQHTIIIQPISGEIAADKRKRVQDRNLGIIKEFATMYGCLPLLRNVDKISKLKTAKRINELKIAGLDYDQSTWDLIRYIETFNIWCEIFNKGLNGAPVYKNPKVKDGSTDKAGNPANVIPIRVHIVVYDNNYQLSFAPFVERYNKDAKSGLEVDLSKYRYEKTDTSENNNGGGITNNGISESSVPTEEIASIDTIEFGDIPS